METAESPLEVLSRAAVMLQRSGLQPPSYDEARSLSQQQNLSLQKNCKIITGDPSNPVLNVSTKHDKNGNSSGKWKRERKYQHKTTVVASTCDSSLNDYKSSIRSNGKCNSENGIEPLDMSKRTATRDRGEPPSYFQSILCSNYGRRQTDIPVTGGNHSSQDTTSYPSSVTSSSDKEAMCDQVINEHFRRSLGRDYVNVFSSSKPVSKNTELKEKAPSLLVPKIHRDEHIERRHRTRSISPSPLSVDDHFAKALGDTWIKLQQKEKQHIENQKENADED